MRFVSSLVQDLKQRWSRRRPAPVASPADLRSVARVPLNVATRLRMLSGPAQRCVVADVNRYGVRLVVDGPLPLQALDSITIFFNGFTLRRRLQGVWTRERGNSWEIGARFLPGAPNDFVVMENFVQFLRWRERATA